jgi:hypothetical protein
MKQVVIAKDLQGEQVQLSLSDWFAKRLEGYIFIEVKAVISVSNTAQNKPDNASPQPKKKGGCGCGK